jgi:GntR family transcriptional regulator, transcriptional repressor for pyruvate dehydrogenase complex
MPPEPNGSAMTAAASRLRAIVAKKEEGAFLGGEVELQQALGVSRTTLRQVARLLEREGALTVKRGPNGGYFASRPSYTSIEAALTAYLEILDVRIGELLAIASITWSETVRQAAGLNSDTSRALAGKLAKKVRAVDPDISYRDLIKLEQGIRSALFELIDSPYMKLIFQVNIEFARRQFEGPGQMLDQPGGDAAFVAAWRSAKLLELEAIALGDRELGTLAAERTRRVWGSMMIAAPLPPKP